MRVYSELVTEFASKNAEGKQKWINESTLEDLKTLRNGLSPTFLYGGTGSWLEYIDVVISKRIREERDKKLKELGI